MAYNIYKASLWYNFLLQDISNSTAAFITSLKVINIENGKLPVIKLDWKAIWLQYTHNNKVDIRR